MKSVKVLLGTVLCLAMLSGQAMATTTLTFDGYSNLGDYGRDKNVEITGSWTLFPVNGDGKLLELSLGEKSIASLAFPSAPVFFESFKYSSGSFVPNALTTANIIGYDLKNIAYEKTLNITTDGFFNAPEGWAGVLFTKFDFSVTSGTLLIDDFKYAAAPLPGASVFLFSGLLGLVGLRRRQIV